LSDTPPIANGTQPPVKPASGAGGDVVLPRAVRRAAQRANELQRAMHGGEGGEETSENTTSVQPDDNPPVAEPEQQRLPLGDEPSTPPQQPPPTDTWEQRYRTLQGKYDREIPNLQAQVTSLERLIGSMRDAPAAQPLPPPAPAPAPPSLIPQEDIESYGPELIEASRRWAAAEYNERMSSLQAKIDRLEGAQTQLTEAQVRDRVKDQLNADPELRGRWEQLNTDQGFLNWLQEIDPLAGRSRYEMLQQAYVGGDAVRTGMFFKAYIAGHTVSAPPPYSPQTAMPGNGQTQAGGRRLDEWASPGRAAGSSLPGNGATAERRVWTNREISQFYRERTDGKWRHREAEAYQLEADILAAGREGRVRNV
jgi:hypothetical protein